MLGFADPGAGHRSLPTGDILGVFEGRDLMITVGLDFLYRRVSQPLDSPTATTTRLGCSPKRRSAAAPMSSA
jgi:hypothetical protein